MSEGINSSVEIVQTSWCSQRKVEGEITSNLKNTNIPQRRTTHHRSPDSPHKETRIRKRRNNRIAHNICNIKPHRQYTIQSSVEDKMSIENTSNNVEQRRHSGVKSRVKSGRWTQTEKLTFLVGLKKL